MFIFGWFRPLSEAIEHLLQVHLVGATCELIPSVIESIIFDGLFAAVINLTMDDIPIRPSKEYLEQKEASQTKVAKTCTDYLKKSKPRYLPSATVAHTAKKPPSPKKPSPSKKEIY